MQHTNQQFDVIISGGGLSGSLMALSLSKLTKPNGQSLSIAIIEARAQTTTGKNSPHDLFDARVLALSHGSANYLNSLGVWPLIKNDACPITNIDISDQGHFGKTRLSAASQGVNALGYVIEMANLGKAQLTLLSEHIQTKKSYPNENATITESSNSSSTNNASNTKHNVFWFNGESVQAINWHVKGDHSASAGSAEEPVMEAKPNTGAQPNKSTNTNFTGVTVSLTSGKQLTASLLLGCDGMQSPVRKLANIAVESFDYQQVALIANVATTKNHHNKAFERFTQNGPLAMLPLTAIPVPKSEVEHLMSTSRCSLVWTMTPKQAELLRTISDSEFKQALEAAFGSYLGGITHVGKRETFPLTLLHAKQQTKHRIALIGNASHTIHPIAGQGFNLSLRDVQVMTENISSALAMGQDIGSFAGLQAYEMNRQQDQRDIIALTDSLITLFANDFPPLVAGRNIALQALNSVPLFKNALMKKTMGY